MNARLQCIVSREDARRADDEAREAEYAEMVERNEREISVLFRHALIGNPSGESWLTDAATWMADQQIARSQQAALEVRRMG